MRIYISRMFSATDACFRFIEFRISLSPKFCLSISMVCKQIFCIKQYRSLNGYTVALLSDEEFTELCKAINYYSIPILIVVEILCQ